MIQGSSSSPQSAPRDRASNSLSAAIQKFSKFAWKGPQQLQVFFLFSGLCLGLKGGNGVVRPLRLESANSMQIAKDHVLFGGLCLERARRNPRRSCFGPV